MHAHIVHFYADKKYSQTILENIYLILKTILMNLNP